MLSNDVVSTAVARLGGLRFFPQDTTALRELALAFQRVYKMPRDLNQAIDEILRSSSLCPVPSDVYQNGGRVKIECSVCDGQGWVDAPPIGGYSFVRRCACVPRKEPA